MTKLDAGQLAKAFESSQSGRGWRLANVDQLRDFASYTRAHNAVVCNVETFELCGEDEVFRTGLSIFLGGVEDQAIPAAERVSRSDQELREVLAAIE